MSNATPSLLSKITEEAERKYPAGDSGYNWKREAYIAGAVEYCEKIEKIREEVERRKEDLFAHPQVDTNNSLSGRYCEAKEILSIIENHLKP